LYTKASDAASFMEGQEIKETMEKIRQFCFKYQLLGETASSPDDIGIEFPDGSVLGDRKNVKFRINSTFTRMAADGEL
jgi:NitT/TauT family transport system substrate-binding protein